MTAVLRLPVPGREEVDPATVEAARRGERWAQAAVVDRYARPVWALVCRILGRAGRRNVAEDATQDALVAVLRSLPRFRADGPRSLESFVLTIAARTAIDVLRRQREPEPVEQATARCDHRPDRAVEERSLGLAIERAIEQLSPEIRAAFVLRAYHELEYAEIADALAIDIGTVKSRLWRARATLRELLSEVLDDR